MSAYSAAVLADSPDVYYRLNQTSGTTISDSSGNGHTLTANAAVSGATTGLLPLDSDSAITFDYAANAPTSATSAYVLAQDLMTVEFWIKPNSLVSSGAAVSLVAASGASTGWGAYYADTSGVWHFVKQGVTDYAFGATALVGTVEYVVFVCNADHSVDQYVYGLSGLLAQQNIAGGTMTGTSDALVIAGDSPSSATHHPKAVIDELAIYKSALSAARITAHYNAAFVADGAPARDTHIAIPFTQGAGGGAMSGGPH